MRDIETINTELVLADLETVKKRLEKGRQGRQARRQNGDRRTGRAAKIAAALNEGKPALTVQLTPEEKVIARGFFLLTDKPTIFACNVKETDLATADTNPYVAKGARIREDASGLRSGRDQRANRERPDRSFGRRSEGVSEGTGREESGVGALIRATYHLLGLRTYFTAGEKEVRAWTIHAGDTAPKAAGVIHSDFERGFIKAETVAYDDLVKLRLRRRRARERSLPHGRQRIRRERWRRAALQVQRLNACPDLIFSVRRDPGEEADRKMKNVTQRQWPGSQTHSPRRFDPATSLPHGAFAQQTVADRPDCQSHWPSQTQ